VLRTGIAWQQLPQVLGYGSGMTYWRRLQEWQQQAPRPTRLILLEALNTRDTGHRVRT
jgi:transposase